MNLIHILHILHVCNIYVWWWNKCKFTVINKKLLYNHKQLQLHTKFLYCNFFIPFLILPRFMVFVAASKTSSSSSLSASVRLSTLVTCIYYVLFHNSINIFPKLRQCEEDSHTSHSSDY